MTDTTADSRIFSRRAIFATRLRDIPTAAVPAWQTIADAGREMLWPDQDAFSVEDLKKAWFFQTAAESEFVQTGYDAEKTIAYMEDLLK